MDLFDLVTRQICLFTPGHDCGFWPKQIQQNWKQNKLFIKDNIHPELLLTLNQMVCRPCHKIIFEDRCWMICPFCLPWFNIRFYLMGIKNRQNIAFLVLQMKVILLLNFLKARLHYKGLSIMCVCECVLIQ